MEEEEVVVAVRAVVGLGQPLGAKLQAVAGVLASHAESHDASAKCGAADDALLAAAMDLVRGGNGVHATVVGAHVLRFFLQHAASRAHPSQPTGFQHGARRSVSAWALDSAAVAAWFTALLTVALPAARSPPIRQGEWEQSGAALATGLRLVVFAMRQHATSGEGTNPLALLLKQRCFACVQQLRCCAVAMRVVVCELWRVFPLTMPSSCVGVLVTWLAHRTRDAHHDAAVVGCLRLVVRGDVAALRVVMDKALWLLQAKQPSPSPSLRHVLEVVGDARFAAIARQMTGSVECAHGADTTNLDKDCPLARVCSRILAWEPVSRASLFQCEVLEALKADFRYADLAVVANGGVGKRLVAQLERDETRVGAFGVLRKLLLGHQAGPDAFLATVPALCSFLAQPTPVPNPHPSARAGADSEEEEGGEEGWEEGRGGGGGGADARRTVVVAVCQLSWTLMFMHTGHPVEYSPLVDCIVACNVPRPTQSKMLGWIMESSEQRNKHSTVHLTPSSVVVIQHGVKGRVGLVNLGNTCFMNSALQALFAVVPFRLAMTEAVASPKDSRLAACVGALFRSLSEAKLPSTHPTQFYEEFASTHGFGGYRQHDASEFVGSLLNALAEEGNQTGEVVGKLFQSSLVHTTTCAECGQSTAVAEKMMDLALPLPERGEQEVSLVSLFEALCKAEALDGDNKFQCDHCSKLVAATRATTIESLPPVLVVSISRFRYSAASSSRLKRVDVVAVPETIRLGDHVFGLLAVVVHSGSSAQSGHYYSFTQLPRVDPAPPPAPPQPPAPAPEQATAPPEQRWFQFNDSYVSEASFSAISSLHRSFPNDSPYVLVFAKVQPTT